MYLCCVSVVHGATAQGVIPAIVRARLVVAGLLVALIFAGAGLRSITFAALLLAILVTLVAFETARNLRPDAHPPPQQDKTHGDLAQDADAEQP